MDSGVNVEDHVEDETLKGTNNTLLSFKEIDRIEMAAVLAEEDTEVSSLNYEPKEVPAADVASEAEPFLNENKLFTEVQALGEQGFGNHPHAEPDVSFEEIDSSHHMFLDTFEAFEDAATDNGQKDNFWKENVTFEFFLQNDAAPPAADVFNSNSATQIRSSVDFEELESQKNQFTNHLKDKLEVDSLNEDIGVYTAATCKQVCLHKPLPQFPLSSTNDSERTELRGHILAENGLTTNADGMDMDTDAAVWNACTDFPAVLHLEDWESIIRAVDHEFDDTSSIVSEDLEDDGSNSSPAYEEVVYNLKDVNGNRRTATAWAFTGQHMLHYGEHVFPSVTDWICFLNECTYDSNKSLKPMLEDFPIDDGIDSQRHNDAWMKMSYSDVNLTSLEGYRNNDNFVAESENKGRKDPLTHPMEDNSQSFYFDVSNSDSADIFFHQGDEDQVTFDAMEDNGNIAIFHSLPDTFINFLGNSQNDSAEESANNKDGKSGDKESVLIENYFSESSFLADSSTAQTHSKKTERFFDFAEDFDLHTLPLVEISDSSSSLFSSRKEGLDDVPLHSLQSLKDSCFNNYNPSLPRDVHFTSDGFKGNSIENASITEDVGEKAAHSNGAP